MPDLGPYQANLFAQGPPTVNSAAEIVRHQLDDVSWLDISHGWLNGADELMLELSDLLQWASARRPMYGRLVQEPRLTSAIDLDTVDTPHVIAAMAKALDSHYHESIDSVWVNYYRDGHDSVAWHSDRVGQTHINPIVAIVSLGGPRKLLLRPLGGGRSRSYTLASGDLLAMGGGCQHHWEHAIPKVASAPPRMSVTLRRREGLLDPSDEWWRDLQLTDVTSS